MQHAVGWLVGRLVGCVQNKNESINKVPVLHQYTLHSQKERKNKQKKQTKKRTYLVDAPGLEPKPELELELGLGLDRRARCNGVSGCRGSSLPGSDLSTTRMEPWSGVGGGKISYLALHTRARQTAGGVGARQWLSALPPYFGAARHSNRTNQSTRARPLLENSRGGGRQIYVAPGATSSPPPLSWSPGGGNALDADWTRTASTHCNLFVIRKPCIFLFRRPLYPCLRAQAEVFPSPLRPPLPPQSSAFCPAPLPAPAPALLRVLRRKSGSQS